MPARICNPSYRSGSQVDYEKKPFDLYKKGTLWRCVMKLRQAGLVRDGAASLYHHLLFEHHDCKTGACNPSQDTLARALGVCRDTVRRRLSELKDIGALLWINIKKRVKGLQGHRCYGQDTNGYQFIDISKKPMQKQHVPREADFQSQTHLLHKKETRACARGIEPVDKSVDNSEKKPLEHDAPALARDGRAGAPDGGFRRLGSIFAPPGPPPERPSAPQGSHPITDYSSVPLTVGIELQSRLRDASKTGKFWEKRAGFERELKPSNNLLNSRIMTNARSARPDHVETSQNPARRGFWSLGALYAKNMFAKIWRGVPKGG